VQGGKFMYYSQLEAPETYTLGKVYRARKGKELRSNAYDSMGRSAEISVQMSSKHKGVFLWTWIVRYAPNSGYTDTFNLITTKDEFKYTFPKVRNPCERGKVPELTFLPPVFE
jgi:hypothetical protein